MPSSYTLGEHFERLMKALVSSGRYASASEVVRDGLRLLEEREKLREAKLSALRADIREGLESGSCGPLDMAAGSSPICDRFGLLASCDRQLDRRHLVGGRRRGAPKPSRTLRAQNLSQSSVLLLWVLTNA